MQAQAKNMKVTWVSSNGRRGGVKFVGANKRSADDEELNVIVVLAVAKAMKLTKKKAKAKDASDSEDEV